MPPRPSKNEQRRRIVQCAFQVLARDGLESFAMRRVAQEAGCTIGLILATGNPRANEEARKLADDRARTFDCAKDKPIKIGAVPDFGRVDN